MILLCGIPSEPPVARLIEQCDASRLPYRLFNQRRFDDHAIEFAVAAGAVEGSLYLGSEEVPLRSITGVYTRLMDPAQLPELQDEHVGSPRYEHCRKVHGALTEFCDAAPVRVVNRTSAMASNFSKPYQAQVIQEAGFSTPATLITDDPSLVVAFKRTHDRVCYKSISGIRSIVTELTQDDISRIDDVRRCPVQFQAVVPGLDIRVHTIGPSVFASVVESCALDYRYAHLTQGEEIRMAPIELECALARRCIELADRLGLEMAGLDLKAAPDGTIYCFEVNPSPAYSYYESNTGQPIAQALARYLNGA
jgi:hypothetical protein